MRQNRQAKAQWTAHLFQESRIWRLQTFWTTSDLPEFWLEPCTGGKTPGVRKSRLGQGHTGQCVTALLRQHYCPNNNSPLIPCRALFPIMLDIIEDNVLPETKKVNIKGQFESAKRVSV